MSIGYSPDKIMKLVIIIPSHYINEFASYEKSNCFFADALKALEDLDYSSFLKQKVAEGAEVVLNNNSAEGALSISDIFKVIRLIQPAKVILPDNPSDTEESIKATTEGIAQIKQEFGDKIKLIAVVHGATKSQWETSLKILIGKKEVNEIALSARFNPFNCDTDEFGLIKCINLIQFDQLRRSNKKLCILGLGNSGHLLLKRLKNYKCIIDGVYVQSPILLGALGLKIIDGQEFELENIKLGDNVHFTNEQLEIIKANIELFYNIINMEN